MKNINIKKVWPKIVIAIYLLAILIFLLKNSLVYFSKPKITDSTIPVFSITEVEKAVSKLKQRENIDFPGSLNLNDYQFGKTEPF